MAYRYYEIEGRYVQLKPCDNPECDRLTSAMYCCGACNAAHDGHYEIHESGPLGHSELCNERHEQRRDLNKGLSPRPACSICGRPLAFGLCPNVNHRRRQ